MNQNIVIPNKKFTPFFDRVIRYPHCWQWGTEVINLNCKTRILWVMDGSIDLAATDGFALSEAKEIVAAATNTNYPVEITAAHRTSGVDCDVSGFTFNGIHTVDGEDRTISYYDEIWIFAIESSTDALDEAIELPVLTEFMNNGGGVFATGDHASLGAALCENIPRVKSMRRWRDGTPPQTGTTRHDTNVPNPDFGPRFDLQADNIAQRIYPVWQTSQSVDYQPHPLLEMPGGNVATHLPDHPHEGICVLPDSLDSEEYPMGVAPEMAAYGVSAGPGFSGTKPSIPEPKLFGVIGAYDGHQASIGRVVVDSTWHHWLNVNLNGVGDSSDGIDQKGLYDADGNPTPEYLEIQQYFQNIASWLEPNRFRICFIIRFICIRWSWPFIEELIEFEKPDFEKLIDIGQSVEKAIIKFQGNSGVDTAVSQLFELADSSKVIRNSLNPLYKGKDKLSVSKLLQQKHFVHALLGGVMHEFAKVLPSSEAESKKLIQKMSKKTKGDLFDNKDPLSKALVSGVQLGLKEINEELCHLNHLHHEISKQM